jgi:nicotinamide-nucleotide amidase
MDAGALLELLERRGASLATAESLTGGQLAARITAVPGASRVYVGGVVAYATEVKHALLAVPEQVVAEHGVVSAQCARAMATGARTRFGATYSIATTGVAGPDRQEGHPAGTVYLGIAGPDGVTAVALELAGSRSAIQERTCDEALSALGVMLQREEPTLG